MLTGTIVNAAAILAGSLLGMLLTWLAGHFSTLLPAGSTLLAERLKTIIMQGVALCVSFLGSAAAWRATTPSSPSCPWSWAL